jgi:hypothetical protein
MIHCVLAARYVGSVQRQERSVGAQLFALGLARHAVCGHVRLMLLWELWETYGAVWD